MTETQTVKQKVVYIVYLFLWNGTWKGFIDQYGQPVFRTPENTTLDMYGDVINQGVIDYWENEVDALKSDPDSLNEFYRQFPRTENHAFRDEAKNSIFNLTKIYEQIDYNDNTKNKQSVRTGNFVWKDGRETQKLCGHPS